jgi:hypothetical protein
MGGINPVLSVEKRTKGHSSMECQDLRLKKIKSRSVQSKERQMKTGAPGTMLVRAIPAHVGVRSFFLP